MVHPIFRLLTAQPQLVAEHVSAYGELLAEELGVAARQHKQRLLLQMTALAAAAVGAVLAGVAVMLWAALPPGTLRVPWLLLLAPALPLLIAAWAWMSGTAVVEGELLATFRRQIAEDAAMLRSAGET